MVSHSMRAFADFCCWVAIAIDDILKIKKNIELYMFFLVLSIFL